MFFFKNMMEQLDDFSDFKNFRCRPCDGMPGQLGHHLGGTLWVLPSGKLTKNYGKSPF
jgi:hypothetical protein